MKTVEYLISFMILSLIALAGCITVEEIKDMIPEKEEPVVEKTSDEFLAELRAKTEQRFGSDTPNKTRSRFTFSGGEYVDVEVHSDNEGVFMGGYSSVIGAFDANRVLRYGILEADGGGGRLLSQNQLQDGSPPMPIIPCNDIFWWKSADGNVNQEFNNTSVWLIRAVNYLKSRLGIPENSKMLSVEGTIIKRR